MKITDRILTARVRHLERHNRMPDFVTIPAGDVDELQAEVAPYMVRRTPTDLPSGVVMELWSMDVLVGRAFGVGVYGA